MASTFEKLEARLLAEPRSGDNAPELTVSELSNALKRVVEDRFGHIRLRGEISGYKRVASGHAYLTLKDDRACIDAVIWKTSFPQVAFAPEDGIEVIATGRLTTYPGRSKYQIVIEKLELAGEGALMLLLERLKARLGAEGLFDAGRKRPLPYLPRTIGVVTSPTGAVIRDILHRLADRCPARVLVWPVPVQGEGAAAKVSAAIRGFGGASGALRPDLLIVARGGGSIEDLWAFNEEAVVRAIAASPIPVISAVGHETDITLADHAADLRAPTPTAAAELAMPVRAELLAMLAEQGRRITRCATRYRERGAERLAALARLLPRPAQLLDPQRRRADQAADCLARALEKRLGAGGRALDRAGAALRPALLTRRLADEHRALDRLGRLLVSLDPDRPLQKGYARVEARSGSTVMTAATARAARALTLRFADGAVDVAVERAATKPYVPAKPQQPDLF